MFPSYS
ncbi:hypothetical protein F383_30127 [Gossypium arboreum]|nr:hypothetical protein F383_30127 [Gossypium arboreum]